MKNKYIKIIGAILGTVLLGAIGSGVWERMLSPFSDTCINAVLNFFSFFSTRYSNSLYTEIGNANKEVFSLGTYGCILASIISLGWIYFLNLLGKTNKELKELQIMIDSSTGVPANNTIIKPKIDAERVDKKFKIIRVFIFAYLIIFSVILVSNFTRDIYQYRTILYIEKTIDILAPFVDQQTNLKLRSTFRQIDSKSKFILLENQFIEIAKKNNIKLSEFNFIQ
jgi:hypothetical protein